MKAKDLSKILFGFGDKEVCINVKSRDPYGAPYETQQKIVGIKEGKKGMLILTTDWYGWVPGKTTWYNRVRG